MNKHRRETLGQLAEALDTLQASVESVKDEEQDYFDNMPENLAQGPGGEASQAAIDALESAMSSITEAIEYIREATS